MKHVGINQWTIGKIESPLRQIQTKTKTRPPNERESLENNEIMQTTPTEI